MKKIFRINLTSPSRGVEEFQVVTEDQTHYYAKDSKRIDRKLKKDVRTLAFYNTKLEALQKLLDVMRTKRQRLISRQRKERDDIDEGMSKLKLEIEKEENKS